MTAEQQTPEIEPEATRRRRGCVRPLVWALLIGLGLVLLIAFGAWYYTGSTSFESLVARRIEATLESRMDREVTIGSVTIERGRVTSVILEDVRIANVEGASHPWLAIVPRIVLEGGVESFRQRVVRVGTIEVYDPEVFIEIFPEGAPLSHNLPGWKRGEPRRFEIARIEMNDIEIRGGHLVYQDHRRDLTAELRQVNANIDPNMDEGVYRGIVVAESGTVEYRDWDPLEVSLRSGLTFADKTLILRGARVRSDDLSLALSGTLNIGGEVSYELEIEGKTGLARIADVMNLDQDLEGPVSFDTVLKGTAGDFRLTGEVSSPSIAAAGYLLEDLRASLRITGDQAIVDIASAQYGGGTVTGTWTLSSFEEPRPMSVELNYRSVSLEALLGDWNVEETGLRGAIDGSLRYEFVQDDLLGGTGSGTASLKPGAVAFGDAPYPMPASGRTEFAINDGVLRFRDPSRLRLPESVITFSGTLGLENLETDLSYRIESDDFTELDQLAVNFGRSMGSADFELLGLGGAGTITGTIRGELSEPVVVASIDATDALYNNVPIGTARVDVTWMGARETLKLDRGRFTKGDAVLALDGTIRFPENGEPVFDLAMNADSWPVQQALDLVNLEIQGGTGLATGKLTVKGTPDRGIVRFNDLLVRQDNSRLALNGSVSWLPGEGNLSFDLDVGAESYPVGDIAAFLDFADLPIEGNVTGTLHLEGPIDTLGGAGTITLRNGSIAGEPIDVAVADLRFDQGSLDVRHFEVTAPAGVLIGEASYDFESGEFSYVVQPTTIDLSLVGLLASLEGIVDGKLQITSSGAGTLESPELVIEATLVDGSILGSPIPPEAEQPRFYLAVRDGDLVVRGAAFDTLTIVGEGRLGAEGELSGDVNIAVEDLERLMEIVNPDSGLQLKGALTADLDLGGSVTSLEALEIGGTVTRLDLTVGGERIQALDPIRFALSNGSLVLDDVALRTRETDFFVDGTISLVDNQQIDLVLRGSLDLALMQLLVPDAQADGTISVQADIGGSISSPRFRGTAELRDASLRFPGFPQLISNVYGSLILQGDRVEIDALRATLGGGEIVAGGFVTLQGMQPSRIRINLQAEDVTLRYFDGITLAGDADLLLSGDTERLQLQGDVVVDRAVYYEEFDLTQLILERVLERQAVVPQLAATWQDHISLMIDVTANDTLAIQNNVADMTGSADLDVTGTLANPIILGRVTINEGGTFEFQDVSYRIVQGTVSFQNPFRNDPYFDVTAEGVMTSRGQTLGEVEEYELTVNLTGTLDRITPNISSDPPVGDLTLLSLFSGLGAGGPAMLGGRSVSQAGTALLLSQVGEAIGTRIIPFADAVRVDTVGTSGFNPTVTLEKQISHDLFVIVIYDTASSQNVEIIQWQVTGDWILQFTRDSEKADSYIINAIDARFRRRYEARW